MAVTFRSVSNTTGAPATSIGIAKPTGAATDDVLVARISVVAQSGETAPSITPPTGWTEDTGSNTSQTNASPDHNIRTYWRRVDGSESATLTWNFGASAFNQGFVLCYSGVPTAYATPITASGASIAGSTTRNEVAPSIVAPVAGLLIFTGHSFNENTANVPPSGMTSRFAGGDNLQACDVAVSAGATGTKTATNAAAAVDWTSGASIFLPDVVPTTLPMRRRMPLYVWTRRRVV